MNVNSPLSPHWLNPRQRRTTTLRSALVSLLPAVLLTFVFVGVGVVHVTSRVMVVSAGYELSRLEVAQRGLSLENDRLKLELATLKNPARLERVARTQLKLGPPAPSSILSRSGGVEPTTAQAQTATLAASLTPSPAALAHPLSPLPSPR